MGRSKNRKPRQPVRLTLDIESLDFEGSGIAHHEGKVFFVEGALTGERVVAEVTKDKVRYARATTLEVLKAASSRVEPRCPNYQACGGCSMQHMDIGVQVATKARALEDLLSRIGKTKPEVVLPPMYGPTWHYRHRARLSCRYVFKRNEMMVGFHEKHSSFVVPMDQCEILPKHVSDLIPALKVLISGMNARDHIAQIELAVGHETTAMVLRHLEPLSDNDLQALRQFGNQHGIDWWLQPGGIDSIHRLQAEKPAPLYFLIPSFGIKMHFLPTDFTQVNHQINDSMVYRAVNLLDPQPQDRVLDLFCGLGNFSLPLATRCATVKAFEGSDDLVQRAQDNARQNGLDGCTEFHVRNLFEVETPEWQSWGQFDKVLIDPPRDGAFAVCKAIAGAADDFKPGRIVYISCNPSTLARDVEVLCGQGGYLLKKAGVMNMFPHTGHVESIAVLERQTTTV
ncbi:23S rRNA (uracil(1939)-C(5))-methyltransferase RlmD [Limnobacter sp.]|uniref:23S rRNA (uracil(1939)-C(5))-methyltransferase RlmD n=1 Tax=Limnobacter sp. TaxID=2003368 RepID=UPI00258687DE|nr:23S rRNA (uracil(1939)-C(5))-methyltransferase RlmD [Limnobacter sp.]